MSCADNHFRARRAKQQRERRDKKRAQDLLWNATIGPNSDHLKDDQKTLEPNITDEFSAASDAQLEPWEKAPRHLQDRTHEDGGFNTEALKRQARAGGRAWRESLEALPSDRPSDLKTRYSRHWGKRGGANAIAKKETLAGRPISARHVRRLMAADKK